MKKNARILILGSGGREHAFAWSLVNDDNVSKVYCSPGNGGTVDIADNIDLDVTDHAAVIEFVKSKNIDLTIVGPEAPLADGIVDSFQKAGLPIFGPDKYASQLESSKLFARDMMAAYNIPSPKYYACKSREEVDLVKVKLELPLVLKADGLAAGKGVIVCTTEAEYEAGLITMFDENAFGDAGAKVSVEDCLIGEELSVFAVCDGSDYVILNTAQDHKRAFDGDNGPNTGGMGAYSPTPLSTDDILNKTKSTIIEPTLKAMQDVGHPFVGFLYVGLMIVDGDPFVIEFNVRMGDPESQVVLPLLESSLFELLWNATHGKIKDSTVKISPKTAVTVVLAAEGYPASYPKGMEISGLKSDGLIFHAGTKKVDDKMVTSGGRVLNVVGFGDDLKSAIDDTYDIVEGVNFDGKFYRKDIGQKGLNRD
ncbi:MAG: phosphoribosylamine--glycine ligase [Candidatus Marinimicrobia bacterium]|nr:phosphoribosylamine--glycine ligase [Candidatus Neomarinimicrobiota bacterium]